MKDLRLVLKELSGNKEPSPCDLERALEAAEIDATTFADVKYRWESSISSLVDRIRPVLQLLEVSLDGFVNAQNNERQLATWLSQQVSTWDAEGMLGAARRCRDDTAMGRAAWAKLGDTAQLPRWNDAIRTLGDRYKQVRNANAGEQAKAHLADICLPLRALMAQIARAEARPERFSELERLRTAWRCPENWSSQWWEVPFSAVCSSLGEQFVSAGVDELYATSLRTSESIERLRAQLVEQGITVDVDPQETATRNVQQLKDALPAVHLVYRAWLTTKDKNDVKACPDVQNHLTPDMYLDSWEPNKVLGYALDVLGDSEFKTACEGCTTASELRNHLGLSDAQVEARQLQRQKEREDAARQKRTFNVAGSSFEHGKDDYSTLFGRLTGANIPEGAAQAANDALTALAQPAAAGSGGGRGGSGKKSGHLRASPETREVAGIVGEMRAFYFLRAQFGEDVVTRDTWMSESRSKVMPPLPGEVDTTSDGYGYDFCFRAKGKIWHVEVKATVGDDDEFEFGISEIEKASQLADDKKDIWRILRIRKVLSESPEYDWLPNPFDQQHRAFFRIDKSSARVHYARAQ